ncbi:MAG: hypothetical protein FWE18_00235 [Alphaproteobacteria bacterium]|nr:hypothetical protein [Alphaproteobacteria bacterium]
MTQAKDFPKTKTLSSVDNFIIDDGITTSKNKVNSIKELYEFMIGSCYILNESESILIKQNPLCTMVYLRLDKIPQSNILIQREYPKLWKAMQNIGINNFSRLPDIYLGLAPLYQSSYYKYIEHSHRFDILGSTKISINFSYNWYQSVSTTDWDMGIRGAILAGEPPYIRQEQIGGKWSLNTDGLNDSSFTTNATTIINTNIRNRSISPNSYSQNLYILAGIQWE